MTRGGLLTATPVVVFAALHAIKTIRPLVGWQFTLDYSKQYNNRMPSQQRAMLVDLLSANQGGLLHFSFLNSNAGAAGIAAMYAVKVVRFSLLDQDGLPKDMRGRATIMVSQVIA
jgi:hypothetical protein